MTVTAQEAKQLLINAFGPGLENLYDFDGDPGRFLFALGAGIKRFGFDFVDLVEQELNPATINQKIPDWEQACGLASSQLALFGTTAQRRNQVIAKLREHGSFSLNDIRAALQPFFLYTDPTQIQILEPNRDLLRTAHTYVGPAFFVASGSFKTIHINVPDDPRVSHAGAQLLFNLAMSDVSQLGLDISSPGPIKMAHYPLGFLGTGSALNASFTIGAPSIANGGSSGLGWTITFSAAAVSCTVNSCALFVEAIGRNYDSMGNESGQGLGAAMFEFAVVADQALLGPGFDLNAARVTLRHITPAHCGSEIIVKPIGAGDVCAIPDLITTLPDVAIPCNSTQNLVWIELLSPISTDLLSAWGSGATDVWAVSSSGVIIHWDGVSWSTVTSSTTNALDSIWGSGVADVWAVGVSGTIIHWNGVSWSTVTSPITNEFRSIWGSGVADVWAVAENGAIIHWNGVSWSTVTSPTTNTLLAIWGSGVADVWAVGQVGVIIHWNGVSWSTVTSPTTTGLVAVWGSGVADVWAVGGSGVIIHWNGVSWSTVTSPTTNTLFSIWGSGSTDVWAVGVSGTIIHWDGVSWSTVTSPTTNTLLAIWGSGPTDIWTVGQGGKIYHYTYL
jgi:hypothetical protein